MSEEKDQATLAAEGPVFDAMPEIVPQLQPSPGLPERRAVRRRQERVRRFYEVVAG
jgi:phospholipid/cholesterol/gamma-HCH transport system ATP-binding protein